MSTVDRQVFELLQRVARLERQVDFLLQHLGIAYREDPHAGVSPEILDLVRRGEKIKAIQLYREITGLGLKEAKDFIESLG
jgi:ribosomal protein L7/L12